MEVIVLCSRPKKKNVKFNCTSTSIVVVQWRQKNVMHMQNCCFANLTVRFFTKIQDQILKKSALLLFFVTKKKRCVQKKDYISFISIEMTHNIDGIPEKQ